MPNFLKYLDSSINKTNDINFKKEKRRLEKQEEKAESEIVSEFEIRDIYDWDDSEVEEFNNKLIRMTSLLHIISKSLPCFEHNLKKENKKQIIEYLYRLPNMIFMFWAKAIDENYNDLLDEIKLLPYISSQKPKMTDKQLECRARGLFSLYSINLLLNLYYIPVINAVGKNTYKYLTDISFFDYSQNSTHKIENLMMLEQNTNSDEFIKTAILLDNELNKDAITTLLLKWVVRHGIIMRNDKREHRERLESKFFPKSDSKFFPKRKNSFLIERMKNQSRV